MLQSGLKLHNTIHSVTDPKIRDTQTRKTAEVPFLKDLLLYFCSVLIDTKN